MLRRCALQLLRPTTSAALSVVANAPGTELPDFARCTRSTCCTLHGVRRAYGTYPPRRDVFSVRLKIESNADAEALLSLMGAREKRYLQRALNKQSRGVVDSTITGGMTAGAPSVDPDSPETDSTDLPITSAQLRAMFLYNAIPFVGFGFLDNMIMIMAGGYIDLTLGVTLGLSTMAAAGLGNLISDVAGVGLAHYVELLVAKFFGITPPALTPAQAVSGRARLTSNGGKIIGLSVGCIIGLFPLLLFDFDDGNNDAKKHCDGEVK